MHSNDVIAWHRQDQTQRYILIFLGTVLSFFYVSLISQWATVSARDKLFTDYVNHVIQVAAKEHRPAKEVRALVLIKAEDLSLPLHGDEVQISGNGQTLRATVGYRTDIRMPILNQSVYRMRFDHDLVFRTIRPVAAGM